MICYIDTSAVLAVLDADDANHVKAVKQWNILMDGAHELLSSDYVVVETLALLQNRLGMDAARDFIESIIPIVKIQYVDNEVFNSSLSAFMVASKRRLSFVDCVSFSVMRKNNITDVFALDRHFKEQGFNVLP